jgi:predicted RNA binding protein YcfA (HicA-like mRNA interferase family)/predicted RNase H-like HicB family nuclease
MKAKDLRRILIAKGCVEIRQRGSHLRIECGSCVTTIPVHPGEDLGPGLLRSIERDLEPCLGKGWLSGWWVASVREIRGCHTQGRTVDEARRRVREAMELFVKNARSATLVDDVRLPVPVVKAIRAYSTLRKRADQEDRRAALAARRAVRLLRGGKLKMSARDAARLLGVSHQRVHQLGAK